MPPKRTIMEACSSLKCYNTSSEDMGSSSAAGSVVKHEIVISTKELSVIVVEIFFK